jgi:RNA polymerase sigma-70 factor (ECF subfamily)
VTIDIEAYYKKYGSMVYRRCKFLLKNYSDAMDAHQDVFAQLLLNKTSLSNEFPSSLLYTMATNRCLNIIRSRKNRKESPEDDIAVEIATLDERHESFEARSLLSKLFTKALPSSKVIAVLHFVDGMTLEETAEVVGMSVSGVRQRLRRIKEQSIRLRGE